MKKFIFFSAVFFSSFLFVACQRDRGVYAGNDSDTYQPRPAPARNNTATTDHEMKGELGHVDMARKTIAVRLENGIAQTFKFDDTTSIAGLQDQTGTKASKPGTTNKQSMRSLAGKEGSEVTVQWTDDSSGNKMATNVEVTQLNTSKNTRRSTGK